MGRSLNNKSHKEVYLKNSSSGKKSLKTTSNSGIHTNLKLIQRKTSKSFVMTYQQLATFVRSVFLCGNLKAKIYSKQYVQKSIYYL